MRNPRCPAPADSKAGSGPDVARRIPKGSDSRRPPWGPCAALAGLLVVATGSACSDKTVPVDVKVIRQACRGADPMEGVTHFRLRVTGPDVQPPIETVVDWQARSSESLSNIPAGRSRQIEVAAFAGVPPAGTMVSVGRSAPFDIPDPKPADFQPVNATVFLRRVNAFTPTCSAAAPGEATKMKVPRAGHTATVLNDGRVLIAGGFATTVIDEQKWEATETAEIYTPADGSFGLKKPMGLGTTPPTPSPRYFHSAVKLLPSGQVWVGGGERVVSASRRITPSTLVYDVEADVWTTPRASLNAPTTGSGRSRHASLLDGDGVGRTAVVSLGGHTMDPSTGRVFLNDVIESYDAKADTSTTTANLRFGRVGQQAVTLLFQQGMFVAVIGGKFEETCPAAAKCMNQVVCQVGNNCTGQYSCPPFGKCVNGTACASGTQCTDTYPCKTRCPNDGKECSSTAACTAFASTVGFIAYRASDNPPAYKPVTGGADVTLTPLRTDAACARITTDTRFLCCGGEDPKGALLKDCLVVRVESPTQSKTGPPLSQERSLACAVTLADGRTLVFGGRTLSGTTAKSSAVAEVYQADQALTTSQTAATPAAEGRFHHTCSLLPDGTVLVLGGIKQDGGTVQTLDTAEIFTPRPLD